MSNNANSTVVSAAMAKAKRSMYFVLGCSFVVNLLLLTTPLFMLQVYDRVLLSRSEQTLIGLALVAVFALSLLVVMEVVRSWLLNRIAVQFNRDVGELVFSERMSTSCKGNPISDLNSVRSFISAPFILSLFDLPWMPLYLLLAYALHPMLGHIGLFGAIVLFAMALINDRSTRLYLERSGQYFGSASRFAEHTSRNKDAVLGMGMLPVLTKNWSQFQEAGMGFGTIAADRNTLVGAIAKTVRQVIQVAVLGVGAYLTILDLSTAGVMIAASIIIARALAPIEQSIQGWRGLTKAKQSYAALNEFMKNYQLPGQAIQLPEPRGHVALQGVVALTPNLDQPRRAILKQLSLVIQPGEMVGVTGPSGSGKSTLAKLMLGVMEPASGTVRVDNAEMTREVREQYARHIGYLPQDVELFDGTVADNISRFQNEGDERVIEAARRANAHDLILSLPEGYQTVVGPSGENLSGGQRQRIGLARAVYGAPRIVVLDEPSSNLDNDGRLALISALNRLKALNATVVLIAHQFDLFNTMDKLAVIKSGHLEMFGPTKEVLEALKPKRVLVSPKDAQKKRVASMPGREL